MPRRLAAILAADVVGFMPLMRADKHGTLNALLEHRRKLVEPLLERHGGRIFRVSMVRPWSSSQA